VLQCFSSAKMAARSEDFQLNLMRSHTLSFFS
jgi:hypothetical protein